MDEAQIGDFQRPLVSRREGQDPKDRLDAAATRLEDETKKAEESLKPLSSYEDDLKKIGVSKEKAAEIIDAVLTNGYYSEPFKVTAKLSGRLRSREYRDTMRIQRQLEIEAPKHKQAFDEIEYRYQLAASLEQFGQHRFTFPDRSTSLEEGEKMFELRLLFVQKLPDPVVQILYAKLSKFNLKLFVICQEGAIENF